MNLLANNGASLETISKVMSIPVATAQCHAWLHKNLPLSEHVAFNSTAEASAHVARESGPATGSPRDLT